jgi:hypothetical protein
MAAFNLVACDDIPNERINLGHILNTQHDQDSMRLVIMLGVSPVTAMFQPSLS